MLTSRDSLYSILQSAFSDSEVKQKCIESAHNAFNHSLSNRVFDQFPLLISGEQLEELSEQFKKIFLSTSTMHFELIKKWMLQIIQLGCREILNETRHIKSELIELLEWQKYKKIFSSFDILSSYIAAVSMQIISKLEKDIEKHHEQVAILFNYVNKNYPVWLRAELGIVGEFKEEASRMTEILRFPLQKPVEVTAIGIGIAALAFIGMHFFKKKEETSSPQSSARSSENNSSLFKGGDVMK